MLSALAKNSPICTHKDRYIRIFITSQQDVCTASTAKLAASTTFFFFSTIIIQHYCCFLSAEHPNGYVTLHRPGFCKISKSNVLMRSKIREESIRKTIRDNSRDVNGRRSEHRTILYVMVSHVLNVVSHQLEHYSERVGAFVRQLQRIPLLGNVWFAAVQKLPLTA